jgi:hypothetical protein
MDDNSNSRHRFAGYVVNRNDPPLTGGTADRELTQRFVLGLAHAIASAYGKERAMNFLAEVEQARR